MSYALTNLDVKQIPAKTEKENPENDKMLKISPWVVYVVITCHRKSISCIMIFLIFRIETPL